MDKKVLAVWITLSIINGFIWGAIITWIFNIIGGIIVGISAASVTFISCVLCAAASLADRILPTQENHPAN